jgi:hypothetical protein
VKRLHPYCLDLSGQSLSSWFSPLNPKDQPKPNLNGKMGCRLLALNVKAGDWQAAGA